MGLSCNVTKTVATLGKLLLKSVNTLIQHDHAFSVAAPAAWNSLPSDRHSICTNIVCF